MLRPAGCALSAGGLLLLSIALAGSSGERRPRADGPAEAILSLQGDFERGRELLFESALQCRACHRFGTGEEKMGPDLGQIGARYDRRKMLETLLYPSKEIDPKYASWAVETAAGAVHSGILVERTADRIVLQDAEKTIPIPAASVKRMARLEKSIMPDSLLKELAPREIADVLEFLARMR